MEIDSRFGTWRLVSKILKAISKFRVVHVNLAVSVTIEMWRSV